MEASRKNDKNALLNDRVIAIQKRKEQKAQTYPIGSICIRIVNNQGCYIVKLQILLIKLLVKHRIYQLFSSTTLSILLALDIYNFLTDLFHIILLFNGVILFFQTNSHLKLSLIAKTIIEIFALIIKQIPISFIPISYGLFGQIYLLFSPQKYQYWNALIYAKSLNILFILFMYVVFVVCLLKICLSVEYVRMLEGVDVFSVEMYLKQIYLQYQFRSMDIEFSENSTKSSSFFHPIDNFPVSQLYQQQITLENTFSSQVNSYQYDILLTLINKTLLISNPQHSYIQPYAAIEFNFDTKFQVVYLQQKNIFSKKIGLKLFKDQNNQFQIYSPHAYVIQAWILCLSKLINQKGFHQMFKPLKKLGKGNFASVYEVERLTDGARFAVKAFSKQGCFSAKNGKQSLINQLNIMRQLSLDSHPNVLKLEAVYESENSIYIVLELLTGSQLFHRIQQSNGFFSEAEVKEFMFGLLSGMKVMHGQRIMHRDLKPQNIMLRSNGSMSPVIVDYGLATFADIEKYLFFRCGTPGYVAPEIIELNQSKHIEPECDVFSAGVIFHILLTRKAVFEGTKYEQVYKKNKQMKIDFEAEKYTKINSDALDLLKMMLKANPKSRISASQALSHGYFKDFSTQIDNSDKVSSPCHTEASVKRNNFYVMQN